MQNPYDNPIPGNIYWDTKPLVPMDSYAHGVNTRINSAIMGLSLLEEVKFHEVEDKQQDITAVQKAADDYMQALSTAVLDPVSTFTPDELMEAADEAPTTKEEALQWTAKSDIIAARQYGDYLIQKQWDDATFTDYLLDVVGPDWSWDLSELEGVDYWQSTKGLEELHQQFITSEDPVGWIDAMYRNILEATDGNHVRAAEALEYIANGTSGWTITAEVGDKLSVLDTALSVATLGAYAVAKAGVKMAIRGSNGIKSASGLDRMTRIVGAASDPNFAKSQGTHPTIVKLGILDQEGKLNTGIPMHTGYELEEFEKMIMNFDDQMNKNLFHIRQHREEELVDAFDIKGVVHGVKSKILGPDVVLGAENDVKLVNSVYMADNFRSQLIQSHTVPIVENIQKDIKRSKHADQWYSMMEEMDDTGKLMSHIEVEQKFIHEYGASTKQAKAAATAYSKYRMLADAEYEQLNKIVRKELKRNGYNKSIHIGKNDINVKEVDIDTAKAQMTAHRIPSVYDTTTGNIVKNADLSSKTLEGNKVLLKTNRTSDLVQDKISDSAWDYIIAKADDLVDIDHIKPVRYREGYFPKFNKDIRVVLKVPVAGKVNGVHTDAAYWKVHSAYSTNQKAEAYLAKHPELKGAKVKYDHELTPDDKIAAYQKFNGGMYTGGRSKEGFTVDGKAIVREKTADEAMLQAANFVVTKNTMGEVMQFAKDKWLESARKYKLLDEAPVPFETAVKALDQNNRRVAASMEKLHEYITRMDRGGRITGTNAFIMDYAPKMLGDTIASRMMWKAVDLDPVAKGKAIAYHAFMGWLSPAQLIIQTSGAMPVFAKHPVDFTKALPKMMFARDMDVKFLNKMFFDRASPEMQKAWRRWNESGLKYSVNSIPDFTRISTLGPMAKAEKLSAFFAEAGERNARAAAFFTAMERVGVDAPMHKIMQETRRLGMDMTVANKAGWQDGWTGLLFQFNQILAKAYGDYMPVIAGGKTSISAVERSRLWATTIVGLGIGGIALGDILSEKIPTWAPEGMSADFWRGLRNGLGSVILHEAGFDNDITTRISMAPTIPFLIQNVMEGRMEWYSLLGPPGTLLDRAINEVNVVYNDAVNTGQLEKLGKLMSGLFLNIPSGNRHIYRAYYMHKYGAIFGRNNRLMEAPHQLTPETKFMWALGFQPTELKDSYTLKEVEKARGELVSLLTNTIRKQLIEKVIGGPSLDAVFANFRHDPTLVMEVTQKLQENVDWTSPDTKAEMIDFMMRTGRTFNIPALIEEVQK